MNFCNSDCKKACAFILFASLFLSSTSQEDDFTYDDSTGKGPSNWGTLKPEWQTCGTGRSQSPVDIPIGNVLISTSLGDLNTAYTSTSAVLRNRVHDIAVVWNGNGGRINIDGVDYNIIQCHWHSPSEHTFGGTRHELEIHILHQNGQNDTAVVSMVFNIGQPDPFLDSLLSSIRSVGSGEVNVGNVNPADVRLVGRNYYRYVGSLSIPPCTEGVIWTVLDQVKTASSEQIQALKDALNQENRDNSRPTQALNGRTVSLYAPDEGTNV